MRHRGEMKNPVKRYKPKRWAVERSASCSTGSGSS